MPPGLSFNQQRERLSESGYGASLFAPPQQQKWTAPQTPFYQGNSGSHHSLTNAVPTVRYTQQHQFRQSDDPIEHKEVQEEAWDEPEEEDSGVEEGDDDEDEDDGYSKIKSLIEKKQRKQDQQTK